MKSWVSRSAWIAVLLLVVWALWRAFEPTPILVEAAAAQQGPMVVSVEDDGQTRVRERYTISAPRQGRLLRLQLKAGSPVRAQETILAEFLPLQPILLDDRAQAEAEEGVQRAQAALERARANEAQASAEVEFAQAEFERTQALFQKGSLPRSELDRASRDDRQAASALQAARFDIQVAEHELHIAEAALMAHGETDASTRAITLLSPIDGQVMRVFEDSERPIAAGTPILEVGNVQALEVIADFLSQEAVRVQPGMPVRVSGWGGVEADGSASVLSAEVRLVEPAGFTKTSALGVDEQRVTIRIDPREPLEPWQRLGDGYRVEVEILTWQTENTLWMPAGALVRTGGEWSVYQIVEDRAVRRVVRIGQNNGTQAQVLEGLEEGDRVILYPSEMIADGTLIEVRGE